MWLKQRSADKKTGSGFLWTYFSLKDKLSQNLSHLKSFVENQPVFLFCWGISFPPGKEKQKNLIKKHYLITGFIQLKFSDCKYVFTYQLGNYWKPAPLQEETFLQALPAKSLVEKWDAVFLTINLRWIFKTVIIAMVEKTISTWRIAESVCCTENIYIPRKF
jgi:hypothetical protein